MKSIVVYLTAKMLADIGLVLTLPGGRVVKGLKLIIPAEVVKTLLETCFRGKEVRRSGNSSRWNAPTEMMWDSVFLHRFLYILFASFAENESRLRDGYVEDVTILFDPETPVGWPSVLPRELVNGARTHLPKQRDQERSEFVAADDIAHPVPLTNILSLKIGCRLDFNNTDEVAVRFLGMSIGLDIGFIETPIRFHPHHAGGNELILLEP